MNKNQRFFVIKRILDLILSMGSLIILFPVFLFAACGIKISSPGKIFYKSVRMGKNGRPFIMYKFRTMQEKTDFICPITGINDSRVFPFGAFLRKSKIDELPQLINIVKNDMSIVGPRPENIDIVKNYYTKRQMHTLDLKPGLASPGSIFNYTHGDMFLIKENIEDTYTHKLLPIKLEMELYYVKNASIFYDLTIIVRTIFVVIAQMAGKKIFRFPVEYRRIQLYL